MNILNEALGIISKNDISDSEQMAELRINYTLKYENNKIILEKNNYGYTNEDYYDPNGTISLLYTNTMLEIEGDLKDYTNAIVLYVMYQQDYEYQYGKHIVNRLNFEMVE